MAGLLFEQHIPKNFCASFGIDVEVYSYKLFYLISLYFSPKMFYPIRRTTYL